MCAELRIKEMRTKAGLEQREVAKLVGMTLRRYASYERSERSISLLDAALIADALNCTLDELAGREAPKATYTDALQAELNDCWDELDTTRRSAVLVHARDARAAMRGGGADIVSITDVS